MKIVEILYERRNSNKKAIIDKELALTYRELNIAIDYYLDMFDFANKKNMLLLMDNSIEYVIGYFCTLFRARNMVLATPKITLSELSELIKYCEIEGIICTKHTLEKVKELSIKILFLCLDINKKTIKFIKNQEYIFRNIDAYLDNECKLVLGSSGTTASGKRAVFLQETIIQNANMHILSMELTSEEVFLIYLPMCFGYCHTSQFIATFVLGATMVIGCRSFLPSDFWRICIKYHVTSFLAVPTYIMLLNNFQGYINFKKICLKHICFGGAKLPINELITFRNKFPLIQLHETYGMTELGPRVATMDKDNIDKKIGSVGKALPNIQIRIVADNGEDLPCNMNGNIEVKSPTKLLYYYNNSIETENAFHDDWFITGDVGYLDTDGYLFITGRTKNIIIEGGINIYAEEYETLINQYEEVIESKVYGISDKLLGEKPAVTVVVTKKFDFNNFKKYCDRCFGKGKIAKICVENSIPKTYTGKIKRLKNEC